MTTTTTRRRGGLPRHEVEPGLGPAEEVRDRVLDLLAHVRLEHLQGDALLLPQEHVERERPVLVLHVPQLGQVRGGQPSRLDQALAQRSAVGRGHRPAHVALGEGHLTPRLAVADPQQTALAADLEQAEDLLQADVLDLAFEAQGLWRPCASRSTSPLPARHGRPAWRRPAAGRGSSAVDNTRAGTPPTKVPGATSRLTRLWAATTAPSPMTTPGRTVQLAPMTTSRPMTTGPVRKLVAQELVRQDDRVVPDEAVVAQRDQLGEEDVQGDTQSGGRRRRRR